MQQKTQEVIDEHLKIWAGSIPMLLICVGIALAMLAAVILIKVVVGESFSFYTREPAYIANLSPLAGILSNAGILIWSVSASVCFLTAYVCAMRRSFFLATGLLSSLLVLDDMFMFHDVIFPDYLGVSENLVYGFYVTFMVGYLIRFKNDLLATQYPLFLTAGGFLALSILADLIIPHSLYGRHVIEDGAKIVGICCWSGFYFTTCAQVLKNQIVVANKQTAEDLLDEVIVERDIEGLGLVEPSTT